MNEVGTQHISRSQYYCSWLTQLRVKSELVTCITKPALPWLVGTVMVEVEAHNTFHERAYCGFAGTVIGEFVTRNTFWCLSQYYCGWLIRLRAKSGLVTCITEPVLLWLAGTVMGEVGAHNTFHGAIITVVG